MPTSSWSVTARAPSSPESPNDNYAKTKSDGGLTIVPAAAAAPPSRRQQVAQVDRRAAVLPPISRAEESQRLRLMG